MTKKLLYTFLCLVFAQTTIYGLNWPRGAFEARYGGEIGTILAQSVKMFLPKNGAF